MKNTLQILTLIILAFSLPMLTSWLLDINWIAAHGIRRALVILLMVVEFAICVSFLVLLIKKLKL